MNVPSTLFTSPEQDGSMWDCACHRMRWMENKATRRVRFFLRFTAIQSSRCDIFICNVGIFVFGKSSMKSNSRKMLRTLCHVWDRRFTVICCHSQKPFRFYGRIKRSRENNYSWALVLSYRSLRDRIFTFFASDAFVCTSHKTHAHCTH